MNINLSEEMIATLIASCECRKANLELRQLKLISELQRMQQNSKSKLRDSAENRKHAQLVRVNRYLDETRDACAMLEDVQSQQR